MKLTGSDEKPKLVELEIPARTYFGMITGLLGFVGEIFFLVIPEAIDQTKELIDRIPRIEQGLFKFFPSTFETSVKKNFKHMPA